MRARVFISCGQNKDTGEASIAADIAKVLEGLGYDPYIAVAEQSLKGLTENIFRRLSESEYFLFVDFKREPLSTGGSTYHRGSLFSHQELAIAAFLGKQVIAFQEKSVLRLDGIISFLQTNSIEFEKRRDLPGLVAKEITNRWRSDWRNELEIGRDLRQFVDEVHMLPNQPGPHPVRYFHLSVTNHDNHLTAFDCYAYLVAAQTLPGRETLRINEVEYKWRAVTFPNVIIPPKRAREFDAFFVYREAPHQLRMGTLTDSPKHMRVFGRGEYLLTFAVRSGNFPETRKQFYLRVGGGSIEDIEFREALPQERGL